MAGNPKLIVLSEQLRGKSFELTEETCTVGRTEACGVCIPDATISGHHCTLVRLSNGSYGVRDEGSTNGTRVNGVKMTGEDVQPLVHSDILQVGGVEMLFDCESTRTDGGATQTVIMLADAEASGAPTAGMANLGGNHGTRRGGLHRENQKQTMLIWCVIGVLVFLALVALGIFLLKTIGA
jgi:predicted component of type VI protein secretion system